eukprot:4074259-Prymnesium_polylepis.1
MRVGAVSRHPPPRARDGDRVTPGDAPWWFVVGRGSVRRAAVALETARESRRENSRAPFISQNYQALLV